MENREKKDKRVLCRKRDVKIQVPNHILRVFSNIFLLFRIITKRSVAFVMNERNLLSSIKHS